MAAHGKLWEETHPQHPLTGGYHLLILPKDGTAFRHHAYGDLEPHWKMFQLELELYRLERFIASGEALKAKAARKKPEHRTPKLIHQAHPMTMGEMLRAYGHVREHVA
jgi:hypothetical protein